MMRVIHYIPSIDRTWGGTSTYMQMLAKPLGKLADVHILTHRSEHPLAMANCQVHFIPRYRPFSSVWRKSVSTVLDSVHPDVVHVNCCWTPDCAALQRLAQKRGYRVVLTPHGMLEPWIVRRHYLTRKLPALWLYQQSAILNADCIQATAESEKANLLQLSFIKHARSNRQICAVSGSPRIQVVRLGIDTDDIELKTSWHKRKQILFLSRVHVKKGINYLIEAAHQLRDELQGYRIVVAGEGDASYVDMLKMQIKAQKLDGIIQLVGGVYGEQKWTLLRESDFFVLPTNSENFGLAIAESLASGTPVITTVGTPWSDLNSASCGAWIEIGTEPLVDCLRRFLSLTSDDLQQMGRNGRQLIETKYSAMAMAKEMIEMYGNL